MSEFDRAFTAYERSPRLRELFGEVFDDALPSEVESFSFVPADGLAAIAGHLAVAAGDVLLDMACGRGGLGMWIARTTGASLLGVDASPVAIEQARARRARFGLDGRAEFEVGEFGGTTTVGGEASVDAVLCVDAIQFAPDLGAAVADLWRVLRPGGRIALTIWAGPRSGDRPYPDSLEPTLSEAGFTGLRVSEHPEWEERRRRVYLTALAADAAGDTGLASLQQEARRALPLMPEQRRILLTAHRP